MKRSPKWLVVLALVVIGTTGGMILHLRAAIRLSAPGVRLVPIPSFDRSNNIVAPESVFLPTNALNYRFEVGPIDFATLRWLPKDTTYGHGFYTRDDGFQIQANVVLMGADRTSIHQPQYCLPGAGWRVDSEETITIPMLRPHPYDLRAKRMLLTAPIADKNGAKIRGVFVYWFVADTEISSEHATRMWTIGLEMLRTGQLQRWAYISYFAACPDGGQEQVFAEMQRLMVATVPEFQVAAGAESSRRPDAPAR